MKSLSEIAIAAFNKGSDNFGEHVIGVNSELVYNEVSKYYSKTVLLRQPNGHNCTSGIGFYLTADNASLKIWSGHCVFKNILITPEIQFELDSAESSPF